MRLRFDANLAAYTCIAIQRKRGYELEKKKKRDKLGLGLLRSSAGKGTEKSSHKDYVALGDSRPIRAKSNKPIDRYR
jgi:hypothetical protein